MSVRLVNNPSFDLTLSTHLFSSLYLHFSQMMINEMLYMLDKNSDVIFAALRVTLWMCTTLSERGPEKSQSLRKTSPIALPCGRRSFLRMVGTLIQKRFHCRQMRLLYSVVLVYHDVDYLFVICCILSISLLHYVL
ncbi:hypothetical protein LIPSTDRAFT_277029 [Lipomyces starkeyi NRRL Y-11557]|uniref:Uncharacterized protein n=1 Tax=Lipomyces starkeyi NRRL Y-11557 TaxID=675824 RepID=A0A1E3Q945_LIPST|nr:hypothetical protein LIPSTDRAFT_277029 [Lipomyces starkeyi NRRL Y-11557]